MGIIVILPVLFVLAIIGLGWMSWHPLRTLGCLGKIILFFFTGLVALAALGHWLGS